MRGHNFRYDINGGVLCVGHACYDIIFALEEFPVENRKYKTTETGQSPGGPACNAASLLGKWGAPSSLACLLGDDIYAGLIINEMRDWGVDTSLCEKRVGRQTPLSCILVNSATGSRTIINRRDTRQCLALGEADFVRAFPEAPRVLLFDGHEPRASLAAARAFPGALTVLDAGSLREGTDMLSHTVDYCIASETFAREAQGYTGSSASLEKALRGLSRGGAAHVCITLGEEGGAFLEGGSVCRYTAYPAKTLDTSAAGDIFHGAFAWAILHGNNFDSALRLAAVAAGLSVQRRGGRASIPDLEETLRLADKQET
ncbi:MAG: PfkB family carbohydrate kinase [Spirochaetales bacterium]|jgi:sugar/nucleoside kinase (ribokinase family)|nr:PfkB family carbohydrate kinase [Spirochaetales bacterium]